MAEAASASYYGVWMSPFVAASEARSRDVCRQIERAMVRDNGHLIADTTPATVKTPLTFTFR